MKLAWYALGLMAAGSVIVNVGCGEDPSGSGGSGAAGSSSSQVSSSNAGGGSSSSTSSGMGGMGGAISSSSSSSTGGGGYASCSDCTSNTTGALTKECKTQTDACTADADCQALVNCWYNMCTTDADGGCCTLKCATDLNTPPAAVTLFKAVDQCVTCTTCKTLCDPGATAYCNVVNSPNPACP